MSLWTLIRILAGLVVAGVVVFTLLMVRHVREKPIAGEFSKWIPVETVAAPMVTLPKPSAGTPEIDPGVKTFEKARQSLAVGDLSVARDRLKQIATLYPRSSAAPESRRILSEMNLDEVLSPAHPEGKTLYKVQRGDSYLAIAARHDTSLDMIVHLNGLFDLGNLQPGDELLLMPLNFRLLIEPDRKTISVWDGESFVAEYPAVAMVGLKADGKTKIDSKQGEVDGKRVPPSNPAYRGAAKILMLAKPALEIAGASATAVEDLAPGVYLRPEQMEELALLLRPGNEVEIRRSGQ
ncbi:LysM peptidoglycan-binding domain-containing protein [Haloferula sargassicola]|uniref:LysM domain-containing protein n=1 Tax=Haloferula sargassicola TaxID=490096 RepID=A0ABP9UQI1_9BACT